MMHWRARRLLASLPDGTLPEDLERRVRAHVETCRRCRRELGEIRASEALLRRLPASLLPIERGAEARVARARLAALARWTDELAPDVSVAERLPVPVLGLASALALAVLTATIGDWAPIVTAQGGGPVTIASAMPETVFVPRTSVY